LSLSLATGCYHTGLPATGHWLPPATGYWLLNTAIIAGCYWLPLPAATGYWLPSVIITGCLPRLPPATGYRNRLPAVATDTSHLVTGYRSKLPCHWLIGRQYRATGYWLPYYTVYHILLTLATGYLGYWLPAGQFTYYHRIGHHTGFHWLLTGYHIIPFTGYRLLKNSYWLPPPATGYQLLDTGDLPPATDTGYRLLVTGYSTL
jgi:hypothetical protein